MNNRDKILNSVRSVLHTEPAEADYEWKQKHIDCSIEELVKTFCEVGVKSGGMYSLVQDIHEVYQSILNDLPASARVITTYKNLDSNIESYSRGHIVADVQNVDVAIVNGSFGVAENGAVWLTEDQMIDRAVPFLCKHLVLVISENDIVANMHGVYDRIGNDEYGFACFIAGPSKTADIEQSLVIGAHGPVRASVFILKNA